MPNAQKPSPNEESHGVAVGDWSLGFGHSLVIGHWTLVIGHFNRSSVIYFRTSRQTIMKSHLIPRRSFLKQLTLASLSTPFITRGLMAVSPNSVLRHASFGTAGMAGSD